MNHLVFNVKLIRDHGIIIDIRATPVTFSDKFAAVFPADANNLRYAPTHVYFCHILHDKLIRLSLGKQMKALFADEWRENSLTLISSAISGLRNNKIAT